jgi:twinkle protein
MTDLTAALAEQGIRLKDYRPGQHRTTCPACSAQRKKKNELCLAVKIDGEGGATWNCHHCAHAGNVTPVRREASPTPRIRRPSKPLPPLNPEQPASMYDWFAKRGISKGTVDGAAIFVTTQYFPQTGEEERCIAFPYRHNGAVVNHKYRTHRKDFRQDKDALPTLYNIDAVASSDTVIWVEGEMDVLSMIEARYPSTVSLPTGAPPASKDETDPQAKRYQALSNCLDELKHVKRFILAGDMDGPGRALTEELARRLGKERCFSVRWPEINDVPCKDANETLMEHGVDIVGECIENAQPYPIAGLHDAADFDNDVLALYRGERSKGLSTGWPALDEHMTIRPGDLSVVTGIPNHGKSEFLDALMVNMARLHGWRFALCSFENSPDEHIAKLAEKYLHAPFWEGPTPRMGEADLRASMAWVREHFLFIRADEEGPTLDWILEKARAAVLRAGIRGMVVDPWNEIEHQRAAGMTETEHASMSLGKLRRFAQVNEVHTWIVAHPSKLRREPGEAIQAPGLYDVSGSAHFANKADFGLTVHRPADHGDITEIYIRKVRRKWLGRKGMVRLRYIRATGEYNDDLQALKHAG